MKTGAQRRAVVTVAAVWRQIPPVTQSSLLPWPNQTATIPYLNHSVFILRSVGYVHPRTAVKVAQHICG